MTVRWPAAGLSLLDPRLLWATIALVVALLIALGCYSPNIKSATYACGADGGCPDNFHCASDHRCYQEADAKIDMMLREARKLAEKSGRRLEVDAAREGAELMLG